ncbi:hypothetical protein GCM10010967_28020 [Dyadobacter beijingensis]|uniref:DinB-like domain-containing protein n=1 Tax=Dyadobacter beijingensis TaxID=365489 RepID=A0ABQ2HW04_9BACT|nr:DinB family protein [Dyadobacter beijingensis]GGM93277.1 hypothetical protein GCM10010967_28020 [Dyadobacter beijingensis]
MSTNNQTSAEALSGDTVNRQQLLHDLDQTEHDFSSVLAAFQPAAVNAIPFEGSWTAGQVAEHILLSESGIPETILGSTDETVRPVGQYVPVIESIFLDFSAKYESPEFIVPSPGPHDQRNLLDAFKAERAEIRQIAASEDLSLTCTDFEFPQIANLTRWEWLQFVLCHSKRHTRQLRNIFEKVSATVAG